MAQSRYIIGISLAIIVLLIVASLAYSGVFGGQVTYTKTITQTKVQVLTSTKEYTITTSLTKSYTVTSIITTTKILTQRETLTTTMIRKYPITIVDALGRSITIEKAPQRVVSLAPSITEMLFALDAGEYVVGVDSFSNYPPEVMKLRKEGKIACIGSYWNPDLEKIVKLKPDLVIADAGAHAKLLEKFEELKINVIYVHGGSSTNVRDIIKDIITLGLVFDIKSKAQEIREDIVKCIKNVSDKLVKSNASKVKVLILLGPISMGLWSTGSGTFIDYLVKSVGGVNILSKYHGWIQVGYEEIVKSDPEIIIVTIMGTKETALKVIDEIKKSPLATTSAVKKGKIYVLIGEADDVLTRPGPRITEAIKLLAKIIHPEIFGEAVRSDVIKG